MFPKTGRLPSPLPLKARQSQLIALHSAARSVPAHAAGGLLRRPRAVPAGVLTERGFQAPGQESGGRALRPHVCSCCLLPEPTVGQCPGCTQNLRWAQEGWPRGRGAVQGVAEEALKDEAHQRRPLAREGALCVSSAWGLHPDFPPHLRTLSLGSPRAADLGQAPRCSYSPCLTCWCLWQLAGLLPQAPRPRED